MCRCILWTVITDRAIMETVWAADWGGKMTSVWVVMNVVGSLSLQKTGLSGMVQRTVTLCFKYSFVFFAFTLQCTLFLKKKWAFCFGVCLHVGSDTCVWIGVREPQSLTLSHWLMYVFFFPLAVCMCVCAHVLVCVCFPPARVCGTGVCCVSNCFNSTWSLIPGN